MGIPGRGAAGLIEVPLLKNSLHNPTVLGGGGRRRTSAVPAALQAALMATPPGPGSDGRGDTDPLQGGTPLRPKGAWERGRHLVSCREAACRAVLSSITCSGTGPSGDTLGTQHRDHEEGRLQRGSAATPLPLSPLGPPFATTHPQIHRQPQPPGDAAGSGARW